jgi:hypothetical protein
VPGTVVGVLFDQVEAGGLIDAPSRHQDVVRPQWDAAVSDVPGEAEALVDQPRAETQPTGRRVDQQEASYVRSSPGRVPTSWLCSTGCAQPAMGRPSACGNPVSESGCGCARRSIGRY